jgi:hypothetical protein
MTHLISPRGAEAEWPWLLREMLTAEYLRQRALGYCYAGEVFKDRDDDDHTAAVLPEKKAVKQLYHCCRQETGGVFRIVAEDFWLLGYEWPNQGSDRGRRADLVALNRQGGLVVFEGKLANNSYGPFAAVLEGLDYLACLASESNYAKIREGFTRWVSKSSVAVPEGFQAVLPSATATFEVIVLAPADYYGLYSRSIRGIGWQALASLPASSSALSIRFAVSDFTSPAGAWATG